MNRKKPTNKDYGRRHYVSDDDYQTAMRRVPDKAVYNENIVKQSEFKKPYREDSKTYEEMEYHYPDFSFPDLPDWPQPNADAEGEVPGTDGYDYGLVHCFGDLCYCKGQTKCFDWGCTYPLVKAWFDDPRMGVSFSGNQICISASPEVFGYQILRYDLRLLRIETVLGKQRIRKTSIDHDFIVIFECSSDECCGCTGISIGYTTQQMAVSTQQTLTAVGAVAGCTYDWAIASGGGSLSSNTGTSVVYTAPATNAECANNPTITLSCGGTQCGILQIAVNQYTGTFYKAWESRSVCETWPQGTEICGVVGSLAGVNSVYYCVDTYSCNNTLYTHTVGGGCTSAIPGYWTPENCPSCNDGGCIVDLRTAAVKTAGCCPEGLL